MWFPSLLVPKSLFAAPKSPLGTRLEPENRVVKEPQLQDFIVGKISV